MTKSLAMCIEYPEEYEITIGWAETLQLTFYVMLRQRHGRKLSRQNLDQLIVKEALRRRGITERAI